MFCPLKSSWKLCDWLVVSTPLKNMTSSVGMMTFPIYGKKCVPNHQPAMFVYWYCTQKNHGLLNSTTSNRSIPLRTSDFCRFMWSSHTSFGWTKQGGLTEPFASLLPLISRYMSNSQPHPPMFEAYISLQPHSIPTFFLHILHYFTPWSLEWLNILLRSKRLNHIFPIPPMLREAVRTARSCLKSPKPTGVLGLWPAVEESVHFLCEEMGRFWSSDTIC